MLLSGQFAIPVKSLLSPEKGGRFRTSCLTPYSWPKSRHQRFSHCQIMTYILCAEPAGKLDRTRVRSERFSTTYNEDLAEWKDFWQEHKVPESKHAPDVKGRLGNLFNIGAGEAPVREDVRGLSSSLTHLYGSR